MLPFAIDATTGASTTGTGAFAGAAPSAIAISPGGKFAYVTDPVSEAVWTFAIDTDSGAVRNLNPDAPQFAGFGPVSVAIDGVRAVRVCGEPAYRTASPPSPPIR